tara:strand:+ start:2569 stop:3186 length:618 start_codon:yes stop_codon:yes gene_type:complete
MAFKMNGMNFGEGTGSSPNKKVGKIFGTSSRDLQNLSYEERSKYKSWKGQERAKGKRGADHDNTYEAYLASKDSKKTRKTRTRGTGKVKDFFKNLFKPKKGGGKLKPTTIAQKDVYEDFLLGNRPGASSKAGESINYSSPKAKKAAPYKHDAKNEDGTWKTDKHGQEHKKSIAKMEARKEEQSKRRNKRKSDKKSTNQPFIGRKI